MNYKNYISSGVIEDYCLGVLGEEEGKTVEQNAQIYPEVKQEIENFMQALEQYALDYAENPPLYIKKKTLNILDNLLLEHQANELPLLNKYSDYKSWLRIVKPVLPEKLNQPMFVHQLKNDKHVSQIVIWTDVDYPDEVHEDQEECFIILEGKCRCFIEDKVVELGPGGFLEIPMFKHHDVQILERPVLAVVQRIKVA